MKKKLLKIATVICLVMSVLFLGQISAFADVIDESIKPIHEFNFDNDGGSERDSKGTQVILLRIQVKTYRMVTLMAPIGLNMLLVTMG